MREALTSDDRVAAVEDLGTVERTLIDDGELVAELHSGLLAVYRRDLGNPGSYLQGLVRAEQAVGNDVKAAAMLSRAIETYESGVKTDRRD